MTLDEVRKMLDAELDGIVSWDGMDDLLKAKVLVYHQLCMERD